MVFSGGTANSLTRLSPRAMRAIVWLGVMPGLVNFLPGRENEPHCVRPWRSFSLGVPTLRGVKSFEVAVASPSLTSGAALAALLPEPVDVPVRIAFGGA